MDECQLRPLRAFIELEPLHVAGLYGDCALWWRCAGSRSNSHVIDFSSWCDVTYRFKCSSVLTDIGPLASHPLPSSIPYVVRRQIYHAAEGFGLTKALYYQVATLVCFWLIGDSQRRPVSLYAYLTGARTMLLHGQPTVHGVGYYVTCYRRKGGLCSYST